MNLEAEEPALPYTPSNTGRRARVGYFGLDGVGFNDLWPLFLGLVLSIAAALKLFIGDGAGGGNWLTKTLESLVPAAVGFGYLRFLVMGRPPHFRSDLWTTVLALRLDFSDPPLRFLPIVPRLVVEGGAAMGPRRSAAIRHPARPGVLPEADIFAMARPFPDGWFERDMLCGARRLTRIRAFREVLRWRFLT